MSENENPDLKSANVSPSAATGADPSNAMAAGASESAVLKPIKSFLFLLPLAMGAAVYAGVEIGNGEVSQYRAATLEQNTAKARVLRVKQDVPPGAVVTADMFTVQDTFANRMEPHMISKPNAALGKKLKYGLSAGQVIVNEDLE